MGWKSSSVATAQRRRVPGKQSTAVSVAVSRGEHPQSTLRESGDASETHYDVKLRSHIGNQVEIKP